MDFPMDKVMRFIASIASALSNSRPLGKISIPISMCMFGVIVSCGDKAIGDKTW